MKLETKIKAVLEIDVAAKQINLIVVNPTDKMQEELETMHNLPGMSLEQLSLLHSVREWLIKFSELYSAVSVGKALLELLEKYRIDPVRYVITKNSGTSRGRIYNYSKDAARVMLEALAE